MSSINTDHDFEKNLVYSKKGKKVVKQILKDSHGYVKTGELVAIMGPSGSGKTSLLNILSMRTNLSRNCHFEGVIEANMEKVDKYLFPHFGAFV